MTAAEEEEEECRTGELGQTGLALALALTVTEAALRVRTMIEPFSREGLTLALLSEWILIVLAMVKSNDKSEAAVGAQTLMLARTSPHCRLNDLFS